MIAEAPSSHTGSIQDVFSTALNNYRCVREEVTAVGYDKESLKG